MREIENKAKIIKLAIFDVDGVFTDGRIYISDKNTIFRCFNMLDGLGVKMLVSCGLEVALISGKKSSAVKTRAEELGINFIFQGISKKYAVYDDLINQLKLDHSQAAYTGDDLPDLPIMRACGLAISVPNASQIVRDQADYVTTRQGGDGAVREVCDLILKTKGLFEQKVREFSN